MTFFIAYRRGRIFYAVFFAIAANQRDIFAGASDVIFMQADFYRVNATGAGFFIDDIKLAAKANPWLRPVSSL
jgi:hypothetical protein